MRSLQMSRAEEDVGWPCCFVNGNLFAGLHKQSMIFRLSEKDLATFLKQEGAAEFEPMPGRKMKGYGIHLTRWNETARNSHAG